MFKTLVCLLFLAADYSVSGSVENLCLKLQKSDFSSSLHSLRSDSLVYEGTDGYIYPNPLLRECPENQDFNNRVDDILIQRISLYRGELRKRNISPEMIAFNIITTKDEKGDYKFNAKLVKLIKLGLYVERSSIKICKADLDFNSFSVKCDDGYYSNGSDFSTNFNGNNFSYCILNERGFLDCEYRSNAFEVSYRNLKLKKRI